jgi:hypothetical protein
MFRGEDAGEEPAFDSVDAGSAQRWPTEGPAFNVGPGEASADLDR